MARQGAAYPSPAPRQSRTKDVARELAVKRDMEQNETVIVLMTLCGHRFDIIQEVFGCGHTAVAKRLVAGGFSPGRIGRRARGDILAVKAPHPPGSQPRRRAARPDATPETQRRDEAGSARR